jgi:lia operon protein LiaF
MHSSIAHRLLWGIVIVTIGVVFLLNQTGAATIDIGYLFSHYWPVFMIVFGLQGLLLQRGGAYWWNLLVVMLGVMFLGRNMGWLTWDISDIIRFVWPIAIIFIGINTIFRRPSLRQRNNRRKREQWSPITPPIPPTPPGPPPAPPEWDEFEREKSYAANNPVEKQRREHNDLWKAHDWSNPHRDNHSRFIGDVHLGNDYWELRPMSISHFIGDTNLDLTKAQIPIGETRIYVSSFIGDVKVFVPNDLGVGLQVVSSCLIGDVKVLDQKRGGLFNQMSVETPSYADADKRVVIVVSSFIGDVRVTKVG